MRKLLQMFLVLAVLLATCAAAYGEEPVWYGLDDEEMVLTITLPANATTGYEWAFVISDPETFELVTQEYLPDENDGQFAGAGGTWVASFMGTFKKAGSVDLTLNYKRSWEDEAAETRLVKVFVSENNQLEVVSADMIPAAQPDWYELSEDETVLTITLPANATTGYEWDFVISDPETFELVTQEYVQEKGSQDREGAGGTWVASFMGTFKKAGGVDLTLNYKRSWEDEAAETRLVKVFVSENNQLEVVSADGTVPAVKQ